MKIRKIKPYLLNLLFGGLLAFYACSKDEASNSSREMIYVPTEKVIVDFTQIDTMTFPVKTFYYGKPESTGSIDSVGGGNDFALHPADGINAGTDGSGIIRGGKKIFPDGSIENTSNEFGDGQVIELGYDGVVEDPDFLNAYLNLSDSKIIPNPNNGDYKDDIKIKSQFIEGEDVYFAGKIQIKSSWPTIAIAGKWNIPTKTIEWILPWARPAYQDGEFINLIDYDFYSELFNISVDNDGNIICAGKYFSSLSEDPSTLWSGGMITKLTKSGDVVYSKSFSDGSIDTNKLNASSNHTVTEFVHLTNLVPYQGGYLGFVSSILESKYTQKDTDMSNITSFVYFSKDGNVQSFLPNWNHEIGVFADVAAGSERILLPLESGQVMYLGSASIREKNDRDLWQVVWSGAQVKVFE